MGLIGNAIEVDYQAAIRKSNELYALGEDLEKMVNIEMDEIEHQLRNGWKGDASAEYLKKHLLIKRKLLTQATALKRQARKLKTMADNINKVEQFGLGLFK